MIGTGFISGAGAVESGEGGRENNKGTSESWKRSADGDGGGGSGLQDPGEMTVFVAGEVLGPKGGLRFEFCDGE